MEKDCNELEEQCLKYESMYHQLSASMLITQQQLDRAKKEEKFKAEKEGLTPDFHLYKYIYCFIIYRDLYNDKLNRLESLTKSLLKKQKSLKDNEDTDKKQKDMFQQVYNLLQLKKKSLEIKKKELEHENAGTEINHMNFGGADVMMINEENY